MEILGLNSFVLCFRSNVAVLGCGHPGRIFRRKRLKRDELGKDDKIPSMSPK